MPRNKADENAVMYVVRQVCGLYGVELTRMQSRVFTVPGKAGKDRPMFIGAWNDMNGEIHYSGMADLLARPRVQIGPLLGAGRRTNALARMGLEDVSPSFADAIFCEKITVPLWIETKAGSGKTSYEQEAFRAYVQANGEYWMQVKDSVDPLVEWFKQHGVSKAK